MLTAAALGMFAYGIYSAGWAAVDLLRGARLELWAELGLILFGVLLSLAAAFVRVRLPGGLAFASARCSGCRRWRCTTPCTWAPASRPQLVSGVFCLALAGLAYVATRQPRDSVGAGL